MKNTTTIIAMIGALTLGTALTAHAQSAPSGNLFLNVSAGGQFQTREFTETTTFTLFNEAGTVTANQTVGSGFVFDVTGGYRFWRHLAGAVGFSSFNGSGSAAAIAAVPSPIFFGQPTLKTFTTADYGDLSQMTAAVNFQIVYMRPLTNRLDLAVFGGPSIMHVKQDVASATATQNPTATVESQTKTTGKAGTAGVDLSYRLNDRYGVGGFVRYLGGEVDLPAVAKLKVGGAQAGGGIRIRF